MEMCSVDAENEPPKRKTTAEERSEYNDKLQKLSKGGLEKLIQELSIDLIGVSEDSKSIDARLRTVRNHLRWTAAQLKLLRDGRPKRRHKILVEHSGDGFVWYSFVSLFRHGVYPAKDPKCEWRLLSSKHDFSTSEVIYYFYNRDQQFVDGIADQAAGLGLTNVRRFQKRQLYTKDLFTAICLKRLGIGLQYINANLPRVRPTVSQKTRHIYRANSIRKFFWLLRSADEIPLPHFPTTFRATGTTQRKIAHFLQDPQVYPDCRPVLGGQGVQGT